MSLLTSSFLANLGNTAGLKNQEKLFGGGNAKNVSFLINGALSLG